MSSIAKLALFGLNLGLATLTMMQMIQIEPVKAVNHGKMIDATVVHQNAVIKSSSPTTTLSPDLAILAIALVAVNWRLFAAVTQSN
ncbi:hypothetical protein [Pantanalinema sp. GBBB05]|uniref:hypothetical protein n=1 Tax=Pantanalinema sp. GBBB05 TaxID=2604139 RepID=UPI001E03FF50|nr:hypothetical protein [Pantanalinema sp. GBBB05]